MNEQHTPGPWRVGLGEDCSRGWYKTDINGSEGCFLQLSQYHVAGTAHANARLIAASPDLLEALRLCQVRVFMHEGGEGEAYRAAEAALTLARAAGSERAP